jgi:adenylate cyclase
VIFTTPQHLSDYWHMFEGIIPSVVATASRDGTPNVNYISQVFFVDEQHVALSNQFMSKTVANVMENPRVQAIVIDPFAGRQGILDLAFERAETSGPKFEQFAARITAITAHRGMEKVMRLKSADIYRVINFTIQDSGRIDGALAAPPSRKNLLADAANLSLELARESNLDSAIDLVLNRLATSFGMRHAMVLLTDAEREMLTTIASRGYDQQGTGAEVPWGQGVIGMAAAKACTMRFANVGRHFLLANSIDTSQYLNTDLSRIIPLPGLENPQSLIAAPLLANGEVQGVIYAESPEWLAFTPFDEQAFSLIAAQLAGIVAVAETSREPEVASAKPARSSKAVRASGQEIFVRHYAFDDSLFINNDYVIKGVPGRILWRMLQIHNAEGRTEFTNRELRLDAALKLPEFKDNLETRLLLLSRRLAEKQFAITITRHGRGRVSLSVAGKPILTDVAS